MATGQDRTAIPLVLPNNYTWDHELKVCTKLEGQDRESIKTIPRAIEILRKIRGPVCVVAITGPLRMGKSFILSQLFGKKEVFPLGNLMDPETTGIWMWVVEEKFQDSTGQAFTVVLMDSEGIDAAVNDAKATDDHRIFTLSVLLSSILIYNSRAVPTRHDLEGLDYIVKLSQRIKLHADQSSNVKDDSHFYKAFPYFIWVLRDVVLDLPPDCDDIKEYLLKKVFKAKSVGPADKAQQAAESILKLFSGFDAFTLPIPAYKKEVIKSLNDERVKEKINPEFIEGIEDLKNLLTPKLAPKASFNEGEFVTGEGLAALVEIYVNTLNTPGAVPNVQSAWETFVHTKCTEAKAAALHIYNETLTLQIQGALPCDADLIRGAHLEALGLSLSKLRDDTYGISAQSVERYLKELTEAAEKTLIRWLENNFQQTKEICYALLVKLKAQYMDPVLARLTGSEGVKVEFADIMKAYTAIENGYNDTSKGAKDACATVFLDFHREIIKDMEKNMEFLRRLKDFDKKLAAEKVAIAAEKVKGMRIQEKNAAFEEEIERRQRERDILEQKQRDDMKIIQKHCDKMMKAQHEQLTNMMKASLDNLKAEREAINSQNKTQTDIFKAMTDNLSKADEKISRLQQHVSEFALQRQGDQKPSLGKFVGNAIDGIVSTICQIS